MTLAVLLSPAPATADGPGYGGDADQMTVRWEADTGKSAGMAVYAAGFRAGTAVALRIGAGVEQTLHADLAGALRVLVVNAASFAGVHPVEGMTVLAVDAVHASTGVSVQAIGQDPAGGIRTVVGAVPPPAEHIGLRDIAAWAAVAVVLAGSVVLTRMARRGRNRLRATLTTG